MEICNQAQPVSPEFNFIQHILQLLSKGRSPFRTRLNRNPENHLIGIRLETKQERKRQSAESRPVEMQASIKKAIHRFAGLFGHFVELSEGSRHYHLTVGESSKLDLHRFDGYFAGVALRDHGQRKTKVLAK
ncbi:hypothetical protein N9I65_00710 [bacterium]|nr:hypothetical protein [bacterium]